MKKLFILFAIISYSILSYSQFSSDLIVYSPFGDYFSLYIDNSKVNNFPSNKVIVENLQAGSYNISIDFKNNHIPSINQSIFIKENSITSCSIDKNHKNNYTLKIYNPIIYDQIIDDNNNRNNNNRNNNDNHHYNNNNNNNYNPVPAPNPVPRGVFCDFPMDDLNFSSVMATINSKSFDSDKILIAKQIVNSNCMLVSQIKQIVSALSFESNKLDFAEYAYNHSFDPQNYYLVNDAFGFSSSIQSLSDYINSFK